MGDCFDEGALEEGDLVRSIIPEFTLYFLIDY